MQLSELVPAPARGRVFETERRAGLSDAAPGGRVRVDAMARWLQDAAYEDVLDAGVAELSLWVVRRARIRVERFPRLGERVRVRTWGSGTGRLWAERRTSVIVDGADAPVVEAVGLWVHLDPETARPVPPPEPVQRVYADAAAGRVVKARLRHPAPPEDAVRAAWRFRSGELDVAEHVNNAAYWTPLEERLGAGPEPGALDAEIEYREPAQAGDVTLLSAGAWLWITAPDGLVHASIVTG
jgi:acyl-ACP thioesterase